MKRNLVNIDNGFTLSNLPCGALVTNAERVIFDVNDYFLRSFFGIEVFFLAVTSKAF